MNEPHTRSQEEQAPQATQSQKRQIDSDSDDEPLTKRARLTRKNLSLFDKMGKKKKASESTDESGSTKTTSTTTSGFDIQACKNGILLPPSSKTPTNLKARQKRGAESRGTASPTETEHRSFVNRIGNAGNEATIVFEVGAQLLKTYDDEGYTRTFNRAFTGFPKNVGFNNGLSAPQPDFVEGPRMQDYLPFPVDERVSGAVLYKDDRRSVTLPHLAGEWKGPGKDMEKAILQSGYDGATLVYARNQALSYLGKSDLPGHAEVTTFTTDGKSLNFYSHYSAQTEDKTLKYHQYPDASYNLMKFDEYKDGRRHLRNTQDDARDQSCALRDQLKEHWKQHHSNPKEAPLPAPDLEPTDAYEETTQYEDEAGYEIVEQPCQPTPAASTKPRGTSPPHSSRSSHNSGSDSHKRKASSSQTSSHGSSGHASKHRSYWKKDPKTGDYYHKHSDGTVSWLDDDDDDGR
ncbi:hypothetical protein F4802DRAFT_24291 [Xylaria palmicola]|nr:hypothetical protein F4802DRAFT_24291 [Xylaria palmicola]